MTTLVLSAALLILALLTAGATAVRSASRIWLRHWAERRLRGSISITGYLERPHRLLTAASAGSAITLLGAGIVLGNAARGWSLAFWILGYGALIIVVGQLVPRAIARRWPAVVTPVLVPLLQAAEIVTLPLVSLGRLLVAPLTTRAGVPTPVTHERDSIHDLLREGELEGIGQREEIAIISGVVEFSGTRVDAVMTPRADIFALEARTDLRTIAREIAHTAFSRIPVYDGTLDRITGMVHAFDVLKRPGEVFPRLRSVVHAAPDERCNELLYRMLRERVHLAIVRGAGGETLGLVSLEDLLEELVGDIRDEHDEPTLAPVAEGQGSTLIAP